MRRNYVQAGVLTWQAEHSSAITNAMQNTPSFARPDRRGRLSLHGQGQRGRLSLREQINPVEGVQL